MNISVGGVADQTRAFEGEAAPVVMAAHAAQHRAHVAAAVAGRVADGGGKRLGLVRRGQHDLRPIDEHHVATAQHRHPVYRTSVDVHAARPLANGQPDAAPIHAEAHGCRDIGIGMQHGVAVVRIETDGMHARTEWQLDGIGAGESQLEVFHAAGI